MATGVRVVTLVPPAGKKPARKLPTFIFGTDKGQADVIWVDGQNCMSLYPAPEKAPKPLLPDTPDSAGGIETPTRAASCGSGPHAVSSSPCEPAAHR